MVLRLPVWCTCMYCFEADEYCLSEVFNASCNTNEVILMTSAMHGRMRIGKCIKMEYDKVSCQKDVLVHLDNMCSERQPKYVTQTSRLTLKQPSVVFQVTPTDLEFNAYHFQNHLSFSLNS